MCIQLLRRADEKCGKFGQGFYSWYKLVIIQAASFLIEGDWLAGIKEQRTKEKNLVELSNHPPYAGRRPCGLVDSID
jgi:hypothetical protein